MNAVIGSIFKTKSGACEVKKLLGKGKSGASYLAECAGQQRVLKVMHHEPCDYYTFDDSKVKLEVRAYERLTALGVNVPTLYEDDVEREYLLKDYVEGQRAAELIADGAVDDALLGQLFAMAAQVTSGGLNIDYFPTNFVVDAEQCLFYIDYEVNPYMPEWNLANWGIYYWVNVQGMADFLRTGEGAFINQDVSSGIPVKDGLQVRVDQLIEEFAGQGE